MKVAVIGGAGYIGAHVVKELCASGYRVCVFDNLRTGQRENLDVPCTVGDIRDAGALHAFFERETPDAVIHLAALKSAHASTVDATQFAEVNIAGTINILNAMQQHRIRYLVFSSSAAVYGEQEGAVTEEASTKPLNFYGYTKLACEQLFPWYEQVHGIHTISLRYFNAAGYDPQMQLPEKEPENLLPIILEAMMGLRKSVTIFGTDYPTPDGTCIRDYIHVTDLACAHVLAIEYLKKGNSSDIFNLGSGHGHSVAECIKEAQKISPFQVLHGPRRPGDPAAYYTDASKARRVLGWSATRSDLPTIISSMHQVYKKQHRLVPKR